MPIPVIRPRKQLPTRLARMAPRPVMAIDMRLQDGLPRELLPTDFASPLGDGEGLPSLGVCHKHARSGSFIIGMILPDVLVSVLVAREAEQDDGAPLDRALEGAVVA